MEDLLVAPSDVTVKPAVSDDVTKFVQVVTDLLLKKPQTPAEAIALYHDLTVNLGKWVVKDLSALEQKVALLGLWAVEEVSTSCWGRK